jgi:hypothetical protein
MAVLVISILRLLAGVSAFPYIRPQKWVIERLSKVHKAILAGVSVD